MVHFTQDEGPRSKRAWQSYAAQVGDGLIQARKPPASANTWYLSLIDQRQAMVTSPIQFSAREGVARQ
jgi:hypothetical protein